MRRFGALAWLAAIFGVVLLAVGAFFALRWTIREPFTGPTWTVKREPLRVTIVERGTLESAENSDVICRVKSSSRGGTNASNIKWVIDEGTQVRVGDPVMQLDDSGFQEQLKDKRNTVNEKYAKWLEAKTTLSITESQNTSEINTAEVKLNLAELDLKKYVGDLASLTVVRLQTREALRQYLHNEFEKDVRRELALNPERLNSQYLQELNDIEGRIETARSDRETWLDRAAWSQRMVRKGYYSLSQADADQSRLNSAEIALRKVQGEFDLYRKFMMERTATSLWSDFKEAERNLTRVVDQAKSKMEQADANLTAAKAIYDQELDRLRDMEREEKHYNITAPQDGLIVYFIPENSRSFSSNQPSTIAQGEPVKEGQKLLRIPNLKRMQVNVRVHEAMVSKVRKETTQPTGFSERLKLAASLGRADPIGIAAYFAGFEEARDVFRDKDHKILFPGHRAAIRVDAFPSKQYHGRVKSIANAASQADFFSSDIKVYTTMVSIEDLDEKALKPGMSAEVTILADESKEPVLTIPIQSVVGNVAMGARRMCFVINSRGFPEEREITVGLSNDKVVEVKAGLEEGERVVLNPRPLIPDNSELKAGVPGTRRGAEFGDPAGKKGKKGKGGGGGAGGGGGSGPQGQNPGSFQRPDENPPGQGGNQKSFRQPE